MTKRIISCLIALCLLILPAMGAWTVAASDDIPDGLYFAPDGNVYYYENGEPVAKGLVRDDEGNIYYFNGLKRAAQGFWSIPKDMTNGILPEGFYEFAAEDKCLVVKNGIYTHDYIDRTYYYENSIPVAKGLVKNEDGDIYFFTNDWGVKRAVEDGDWYVSAEQTNGLMPAGTYHFNEYGFLTGPAEKDLSPVVPTFEQIGEFLILYSDGTNQTLHYVGSTMGLVADYEGNIYYVIGQDLFACGVYSISADKANGLLPAGLYEFDISTHRLVIKNGICKNFFAGRTYYFENNVPKAAGLVADEEGNIYFFTTIYGDIYAATNQFHNGNYYVSEAQTNGLKEAGTYHFDEQGHLVGKAEVDLTPPETEPATEAPETPTEPATATPETPTEPATETPETPTEPASGTSETPSEPATEAPETPSEPASGTPETPTEPVTEAPETPTEKPTEPATEPTSDTSTETPTDATTTTPSGGTISDPSNSPIPPITSGTETSTEATTSDSETGCSSWIGASGIALLLLASGACLIRKRRD